MGYTNVALKDKIMEMYPESAFIWEPSSASS